MTHHAFAVTNGETPISLGGTDRFVHVSACSCVASGVNIAAQTRLCASF